MTLCDIAERCHVCRLPKEMHGHDCPRLARNNRLFDALWIEGVSVWVDIHQCHATSTIEHRAGAGDERQVRHDDLATIFKSVRCNRRRNSHTEGIRSMRQQQSILSTAELRPLAREFVC